MALSSREKRALFLGTLTTLFPGMIVSGFMPELNVLPAIGWLSIAMVGAGVAGALAAPPPRRIRGAIAGAIPLRGG